MGDTDDIFETSRGTTDDFRWRETGSTTTHTTGTDPYTFSQDELEEIPLEEIEEELNEEISEETQKEIDKIGTPGKRTIHDLIAAFKVDKENPSKISHVEQLEDESWATKTWADDDEPLSAGAAPDERPSDIGT